MTVKNHTRVIQKATKINNNSFQQLTQEKGFLILRWFVVDDVEHNLSSELSDFKDLL